MHPALPLYRPPSDAARLLHRPFTLPGQNNPDVMRMDTSTTRRLVSLDAFRGAVIAGMLVVNNVPWTSATPRQLMHAGWGQGVTLTDMILPWFVLAMGVAVPQSHAAQGAEWLRLWRVVRRAALLVGLGVLLDSLAARQLVLNVDVLQLIGLSYLVAATLAGLPIMARLGAAAALLGGHAALLALVPVPGSAPGVLREGHNIVQYLNDTYLTRYHVAGLLSVAPASALALIGGAAGEVLRRGDRRAVPPLLAVAVVGLGGLALAAAGWAWGAVLPLSKPLWTASYALLAGGFGLALLAVFYALADVAGWHAIAAPLAVLGVNAIVAYVVPILFKLLVLDAWQARTAAGAFVSLESAIIASLVARVGTVPALWLYTGAYVLLWWAVLVPLYRARIFVRV
jgi:predicted acyltransferase